MKKMKELTAKAIQIAELSLVNPSVDVIASTMGVAKITVLGSYASLKKAGLAVCENGNIVLTEAGIARFNPVVADDADIEIAELINTASEVLETVSIKAGTRKAMYHEIVLANPGKTYAELNKLLQAATGMPRRNCYVIQNSYAKLLTN